MNKNKQNRGRAKEMTYGKVKTDAEGGHRSSQSLRAQRQNQKPKKAREGGKDSSEATGVTWERNQERAKPWGNARFRIRAEGRPTKMVWKY